MRTKAIVVEISRSSVPFNNASNASKPGICSGLLTGLRCGTTPMALLRSLRYFISRLSSGGR